MQAEFYDVKWKDHLNDIFGVLRQIRTKEAFSDVILYCNGEILHAHKVILAACSTFFERMLSALPAEKSKVLVMTDMDSKMLRLMLDFMYDGEVAVDADDLEHFMETAEKLEIRGLKISSSGDAAKGESGRSESVETSRKRVRPSMETGDGGEEDKSWATLHAPVSSKTASVLPSPRVSQPSVFGHQSLAGPLRRVDVPTPRRSHVQSSHPNLGSADDFVKVEEEAYLTEEVEEEESVDEEGGGYEESEDDNEEGADIEEDGEQRDHGPNDPNVGGAGGERLPKVIPREVSVGRGIIPWGPGTLIWRGVHKTGTSTITFCGKCGFVGDNSQRVLNHIRRNHQQHNLPAPFECPVCVKGLKSKKHLKFHCLNKHGMKRKDVDHMLRVRFPAGSQDHSYCSVRV